MEVNQHCATEAHELLKNTSETIGNRQVTDGRQFSRPPSNEIKTKAKKILQN